MDYKEKVYALLNDSDLSLEQKKKLESIFPELQESEDERIRKTLIDYLQSIVDINGIKGETFIAWLEKQGEQKLPIEKLPSEMKTIGESLGFTTQEECDEYNQMVSDLIMSDDKSEQKPVDKVEPKFHEGEWNEKHHKPAWSEEDEIVAEDIEEAIRNYWHGDTLDILLDWLKFLKDRVQPKQEWSEQEQIRINRIVGCLENLNVADNDILLKDVNWLKSLKGKVQQYSDTEKQEMFIRSQRPHFWRPSDEQMKALKYVAYHLMPDSNYRKEMFSLYEDLKKLK